jgi:diguanylate cyclase (GGDEF)-like protein
MMRIGEFAKDNKITVRALRHYESLGLIEPASTDPITGYRDFEEYQSRRLKVIVILKQIGFSLSEISELLSEMVLKREIKEKLEQKYLQARIDQDSALIRSLGIEKFLTLLNEIPDGDRVNLMEVSPMGINELEKNITSDDRLINDINSVLIKARNANKNITVMIIDIDHFLRINKNYGHKVGDAVIDAVRRGIIEKSPNGKGLFWGNISIMEHKGGDEFINWINGTPSDNAEIAQAICGYIGSLDFSYLNMDEHITVSIGYTHSRNSEGDAKELISQADSALYSAKLKGRNRTEEYQA